MTRSTYPRTEHLGEPTTPREARGTSGTPAVEYAKGIHGQKIKTWSANRWPSWIEKQKKI